MFRAGGKVPDDAACPTALFHVWCWFAEEIMPATSSDGSGITPLTWGDVQAWATMTGRNPTPDECRLLVLMHSNFRSIIAEQVATKTEDKPVEDASVARSIIRKAGKVKR